MNQRDSAVDHCSRHRQHAHGDDDEPIGDGGSFRSHAPQWRAALPAILQSGGGGGLSAQIGALQQSWRANPPADFARTELWEGAVAVRYAHLAATAINMRTGGGIWSFVGLSECRGPTLYYIFVRIKSRLQSFRTSSEHFSHFRPLTMGLGETRKIAFPALSQNRLPRATSFSERLHLES